MTFTHKLARRLAILRAPSPHCAMGPALALLVACSAGVPTGIDTGTANENAPLVVNPRSLILEANQVSVFKAYASGVPGDSLVTSIEWTATGGSIGLDGTYSSPTTGDYRVVGKRHGPNRTTSDTATVTVVPPQPTISTVLVSPQPATVTATKQQTFSAVGKLSDGSTVAIGVTWSATGGSIDPGGVFTAGSTAGNYQVIAKAASANVADTVPVTVVPAPTTAPSSPSALYPNLPTGLNQLFQYDGNGLPSGWGTAGMTMGAGDVYAYSPGTATTVNVSNAPVDPPTVYDLRYPAGLAPGTTPAGLFLWQNNSYQQQTEYYEAGWFTLPGTDFEGPGGSGEWKILGYWAVGQGWPNGYDAQIYGVATPAGSSGSTSAGVISSTWSLSIRAQQQVSWAAYSNGALKVQCGKWYRYEIHMVLENPVGAKNGILEVWLTNVTDGGSPVKILSYSDRTYRNTSNAAGFWKRTYVPVWGGNGPAPKTRNDHLQIARIAGWGR